MKQDAFTKTLKKELAKYGAEYSRIVDKLTERIFRYLEAGETIVEAYNKARKEINFYKLNAEAVEDAVYEAALKGYGINAPALEVGVEGEKAIKNKLMNVAWTADKMKLSTRLHGVDKVLRSNIKSTVRNSLNTYKTIQDLSMKLYDGYNTTDNVLREAELPKYLNEIKRLTTKLYSGDVRAARASKIYKATVHDIRKLKTDALSAAYEEVTDAATTDKKRALRKATKMTKLGASKEEVNAMLAEERKKAVKKALDVAAQEKTRYYAKRIARTESARAYYEGQMARAKKDPDIFGFRWEMSTAHVHSASDCQCAAYSNLDIGYGKGVYPKDKVPELPAHPNCMCHLNDVYQWEVQKTDGKDTLPKQPKNKNRLEDGLKESQKGNIIESSIRSPIERNGVGNPSAIAIVGAKLNKRQKAILDKLPDFGSEMHLPKKNVSMRDLSALTAYTGDEFAMFTNKTDRLIIRGSFKETPVGVERAKELKELGYKWSGHVHPSLEKDGLRASLGDYTVLRAFEQEQSVIYNAAGQHSIFESRDFDG